MGTKPIRILHLSDFHFGESEMWNADRVLDGLCQAVAEMAPDVVAVTGDVANTGGPDDYRIASEWIDRKLRPVLPKGFPKRRILFVPGNHDVGRSAVKTGARGVQAALLKGHSQDAIAGVLDDAEERRVMLRRHDAYLAFANRYRTKARPLDVPWWSSTMKFDKVQVRFVGLCSSWMSCGDGDHGRLLVGRYQANAAIKTGSKADFTVVLVHHPWSCLAEFDAMEIQDSVLLEADVVLRGHLHAQRSTGQYDPDNACLELAAGAAYGGSDHANAFQLVELLTDSAAVRVHYRIWHRGCWIQDRNAYQAAGDGTAEFSLRSAFETVPLRAREAKEDPKAYLKWLREDTRWIDIRGLQVGDARAHRFPIEDLYIPVTGVLRQSELADGASRLGQKGFLREPGRGMDLRRMAARCLAVVGDPGSGKTTFLRRVAFSLCKRALGAPAAKDDQLGDVAEGALPVFIPVDMLGMHIRRCQDLGVGRIADTAPTWVAHFAATRCTEFGHPLSEEFFVDLLDSGRAVVLLDGLDQAASTRERQMLSKLMENAAAAYPACRFIVTTRPAAYKGEIILDEFAEARIAPLDEEAIEVFFQAWCGAIWAQDKAEATRHRVELAQAVGARPEIRRMATNPVMLTALAVLHWDAKRLPEQRADLYESILQWLAKARERREGRPNPDHCLALHQNLALAMQNDVKGRRTQVSRHWAARAIASRFRDVAEEERIAAAEAFLQAEEVDSGIVVGRGERDLCFWHLTFQEYLAARALAGRDDDRAGLLSSDRIYTPEWREVVLLLAGVLYYQDFDRVDRMITPVLDNGVFGELGAKARCASLLSQILRDLSPVEYRTADARYDNLLKEVTAVFDAERSRGMAIGDAIEAAEAVGRGGDPRFADPLAPLRDPNHDHWVRIPAGEFRMGAQKDDATGRNYDPEAWGKDSKWRECPVHQVSLSEYRIGRYPVTVCEYALFVDDGGYAQEQFWTAGEFGEEDKPGQWETQLEHPTRPVVNVSWREACAYAAWATAGLHQAGCEGDVRLPTEAEWERAARGTEGCKFPWGSDEANDRLMNYKSNVGNPTPVGAYPLGASPEGICDLAGNVWEWCQDWYGKYGNAKAVDPQGPTSGSGRVLRGGAWCTYPRFCRSAFRSGSPDYRGIDFGFRVVLSGGVD